MNLSDKHARRLVHLSTLPSVVMDEDDREALRAGARALEREARQREHDEAMERAADDTRPIGGKR